MKSYILNLAAQRSYIFCRTTMNFNINTGKVVSLITDLNPPGNPYGIEFSPNSDLLYVSYYPGVSQYNLLAGAPIDIYNSGVVLQSSTREPYSSLQLGPDAKIYVAKSGRSYIDIIENPNVLGIGCNYKYNEMYLEGRKSGLGLPTFVSSLFYIEGITFENTCFGDTTKFLLSDVVDSAVWDFDDLSSGVNNKSTDIEPTHVFSNPGTYEVSVTPTVGTDTAIETTTVTIYDLPQISSIVELKQCDDDLDGFSAFNLDEVIPEITTNSANETISFFESQIDAENNNNPITNRTVYTNQTVSKDIVWARVENNNACYRTSQVKLIVTTTQIPNTFTKNFYVCDDNTDGISQFDFSSIHAEIEAMFPIGQQLIINYYRNEADALAEENPIMDTSNHRNIGYPNTQQVYIRVDGGLDNDCLGLGAYINLYVEPIPVANPVTIDRQCDDDQDGEFPFDVSLVESTIIGGQSLSNVTLTYLDENNNLLQNPLPNPFFTTSQVVTVRVTNNNISDGSCFAETALEFIVDKQPLANHVANQISCDDGADDTDGFHDFDTSQIESDVLNGQTGMEVHYYSESDIELPSPLPNPFASGTQTITVEVINPMNRSCIAKTDIVFIVDPLPDFSIDTPQVVCSSDPTFTVVLDPIETNLLEVYDYEWAYQDGTILSNAPTLTVFTPGTYSITLTKTDGSGCSRTRDIFVNTSEMAQINQNDISVVDNSNNNTIAINTSSLGQGDYEFSLDSEFSNYQDIPFFENVSSGIHTLYVRDKKGCGISLIDISVIGYPKVFTPNNDGYNDSWQIDGVDKLPESKILIYDRYGKLLKELASHSTGWDGTFNGNLMPSNDYWFIVNLSDGRTFKGHFSLIR
ncbi:T9SS type B sorting domain-containing protein [Gillisia hiemivivida]|uniref:T9SS type B sorting domain-containing protein n=2 Tax=Gillisia hiemivivida TaxID=291190 RepID=A0A5C6ZV42_9FLAO|nr:T9SS type B sorting domain-containing protein [Gillisia hiemivivida]